jgi:hypothetical protein
MLRTLASVGVFAETPNGRFRLTPAAATLRSGVPGSLRDFALMMVDDYNWAAWGALLHGVQTGGVAFDHVHGQRFFDYLVAHPEKQQQFAASMASISGAENTAIARAYAFGRFGRLVDVGGAHGHLLATILRRNRKGPGRPLRPAAGRCRGGRQRLAHRARGPHRNHGRRLLRLGSRGRGRLHDEVHHPRLGRRALRPHPGLCRDAMAPGGRVLVVENVIEPGNRPGWPKLLDINMLALLTGRSGRRRSSGSSFARAGLTLRRVVPTASPISVLEATAA